MFAFGADAIANNVYFCSFDFLGCIVRARRGLALVRVILSVGVRVQIFGRLSIVLLRFSCNLICVVRSAYPVV